MLTGIEVHAIDCTCSHNTPSVKVFAIEIGSNLQVGPGQACAPFFCAMKLLGNGASRTPNLRWTHDQNGRRWHSWLDRRFSDLIHKSGNALSRRPSVVVRMTELKIVCAEHE
jgi:hypothetical protein